MDGNPQPARAVHYVDIAREKMRVQLVQARMSKSQDASERLCVRGHLQLHRKLDKPLETLIHEWSRIAINCVDADALDVFERRLDCVDGGKVRHPDGIARRARLGDRPCKAVRAVGILKVEPAA